jgi:hypothetical protein
MSSIREGLSDDIISQLLASFADGKSISTFYLSLQSCRLFRHEVAFTIIRDALVHRLKSLAADDRLKPRRCEEMRDCIDILREEIRTGSVDIETGRLVDDGARISSLRKSAMTIVSEWCAIVDYFDINLCLDEYVVWVGQQVNTRFGQMGPVCIRTPFWSITHLQYMHAQIDLACEALVPPNPTSRFAHLLDQPYGSLSALTAIGTEVMERLRTSMSLDEESNRFALTPNQFEFATTIAFTPTPNDQVSREMLQHERHLRCLWDRQDDMDFDDSLTNFGEDCLRILKGLQVAKGQVEADVSVGSRSESVSQFWRDLIGSDLSSFDDDALL